MKKKLVEIQSALAPWAVSPDEYTNTYEAVRKLSNLDITRGNSIVWLILIGVVGIELLRQNFDIGLSLVASISGFLLGIFLSRIYRLDWSEETTKVVSRLDLTGRLILAAYVLFTIGRNWIFGHWVQASDLMVFTLCFMAGIMIGRVGATRRGIRLVLYTVGVIKSEGPGSSPAIGNSTKT